MDYKILLLALVAFSFLLAGCGGKNADEAAPGAEASLEETPLAEVGSTPSSTEKEELAGLFDIEIDEPPGDFEYSKAPGEE